MDEYMRTIVLWIYNGIKFQVEGLEGERISQMCHCTGNQSWHAGDWWNALLWVKQCLGSYYAALNGRLPWQLQRLFNMKLFNEDGDFVRYWSALELTTIAENLGYLDPVSK